MKPRSAPFSGTDAAIQNKPPLAASDKAGVKDGLSLVADAESARSPLAPIPFDVQGPRRLPGLVAGYVEQCGAHPLERDAARLYGRPNGGADLSRERRRTRHRIV